MGVDDAGGFRRVELVVRATFAVKQGSPPLLGRGKDPSRYSNDELLSYLDSIYWGCFDELSKDDLVSYAKRAMKEGAPQLVEHGRYPGKYSENQLRDFLRGICCNDISEMGTDELVVRCKLVTEQGAPSITSSDDDFVTWSRDDLIIHLDCIREAGPVTEVPDPKGPAKGGEGNGCHKRGLGNPAGMKLIGPMQPNTFPRWQGSVAVARPGDAAMRGRDHSGKISAGFASGTSVGVLVSAQECHGGFIFLPVEGLHVFADHENTKKRRCA